MSWSPQQDAALKAVDAWIKDPHAPQVFRLFGYAGTGKAQPLDAMVMTPSGPRCMGDLAVGEPVLGADGVPVEIRDIFPQGIKSVYRVLFRDGTETRCCGDHLWSVEKKRGGKTELKTISTKEMLEVGVKWPSGDRRWKTPLAGVSKFSGAKPAFPPYTIGAPIGDGCLHMSSVDLANPEPQIFERVKSELPDFVVSTRDNGSCLHHTIADPLNIHWNRLKVHLQSVGIDCKSKEKFIPQEYLLAPAEDRIDLLHGLMDTDGYCRGNRTAFATSSPLLAETFKFLVRSLGGVAIEHKFERDGVAEYQINVKTNFCPFYVSRKADEWSPSWKNPPSKYIDDIVYDGQEEQQCISVTASDGLYLTDDFIVTHNTTLAKHLAEGVNGEVLFGAFTGKAAQVLRQKGCHNASTIHSMIYEIDESDTATPTFQINGASDVKDASLVIIDECSMVGPDIGEDLLYFGVKILVLGDPAQLPPVKGTGFFTEHEPDFMLTEVHRQAADNPIINLSMQIREGGEIARGNIGSEVLIRNKSRIDLDLVQRADQFLCGMNRTRETYNRRLKEAYGFGSEPRPVKGDRLVCLRNNKKNGLFNGSIWNVLRAQDEGESYALKIKSADGPNKVNTDALRECFEGGLMDLEWSDRRGFDEFDFGYALTTCLLYTSPSPRDLSTSRMPSSA